MKIYRSVDIEDEVRQALNPYATVYVRPLPANFTTPSTLIECVGGTSKDTIDTFSVKLSTRAKTDAEAPISIAPALSEASNLFIMKIPFVWFHEGNLWFIVS